MSDSVELVPAKISSICDAFEDQWNLAAQPPEIGPFLHGVPPDSLRELLRQLLAVDIEFRISKGYSCDPIVYRELGFAAMEIVEELCPKPLRTKTRADHSTGSDICNSFEDRDPTARIGPYNLLEKIGVGGMGVVWLAEQKQPIYRRVALKLIQSGMATRQFVTRFEAERQSLAMMEHPNIAKIFDAGTTIDHRPYFAMELVKGSSITEYCNRNQLRIRERLELFVPVCKAIQHAHQKGIIHRDLKPSNVLVAILEGAPVPKVIDFGLAKALQSEAIAGSSSFTKFGQVLGTLPYMSPEQAEGNVINVDTRSDIYSLGAMLYEILVGCTPMGKEEFGKKTYLEVLETLREQDPPRPSTRMSSSTSAGLPIDELERIARERRIEPKRLQNVLRGELDWIVMKCLEKEPSRRYSNANELAEDIQRYLNNDVVSARPPSSFYWLGKLARRHRILAIASAAILFTLMAGVAGTSMGLRWALKERAKSLVWTSLAEQEATRAKEATLQAKKEQARAAIQEKKALNAQSTAENNAKKLEKTLARSNFFLADARWNESRALEANHFLDLIPNELRGFEWFLSKRQFTGSQLTCYGHDRAVNAIAFSPDGTTFASGGGDGLVKLWDSTTGCEVQTLREHSSEINCIAFSPDSQSLLSGSLDGTIHMWERNSGKLLDTFRRGNKNVSCLALSRDGNLMASGGDDRTIRIWNFREGEEVLTLQGHANPIRCVAFSPDGKHLLSVSIREVRIWDLEDGLSEFSIGDNGSFYYAASFSPDGKTLAICDATGRISLVNRETGEFVRELIGHAGIVQAVAFSPDSVCLVSAGADRKIKIWDCYQGTELQSFIGHENMITGVAFSPDGSRIVSGSWDNTVKVWNLTSSLHSQLLSRQKKEVVAVAFSPNSNELAFASDDATLKICDVNSGEVLQECLGHEARVNSVVYSPDGRYLASGSLDKSIKLWSSKDGTEQRTLRGHNGIVYGLAFSPDGKRLASASRDRTVKIWDVENGHERLTLSGHAMYVQSVAFSPDGTKLASGSADSTIKIWDPLTGKESKTLEGHTFVVTSLAFSPDGSLLASGSEDTTCRIWEMESGRELHNLSGHSNFVTNIAFHPNGVLLASASSDKTLKLWDVLEGCELKTLNGHTDGVSTVAFSPDGNYLASGGRDNSVRLWDGSPELETKSLVGHRSPITSAAYSDDGKKIFSIDRGGNKKVWDAESGVELDNTDWAPPDPAHRLSPDKRWLVTRLASEVLLVDLKFKESKKEQKLRKSHAQPGTDWHEQQAILAEKRENHFAAAFHRAFIVELNPSDSQAIDRFRASVSRFIEIHGHGEEIAKSSLPDVIIRTLSRLKSKAD